jgi:predicted nucleotidyltransferase
MFRVDLDRLQMLWPTLLDVEAVWAFGSAKDGNLPEGSDLDIAVLFVTHPSLDMLADLRAMLQEALSLDEIDLVVLNDSSPVLRFEALQGRLLFCRDLERCAGFVSLSAREYEDEMAMVERHLLREAKS